MVAAERKFIEERINKIIALKKKVCGEGQNTEKGFVLINQAGIDPFSLDSLQKEGIVALRRAKRRNMERITLACGGSALTSLEDLTPEVLGYAGVVYEQVIGEDKYTYIEDLKDPRSVTILIKAATRHALTQIKEAVYDGLRAVKNAIDDGCLVPGAGAFELAANQALSAYKTTIQGKAQLGVQAYADALLVIPKTLAANAGFDQQDALVKLFHSYNSSKGKDPVGIDLNTGEPMNPVDAGIYDNYRVKKQLLNSCTVIACNLLLVDEIMRAGLTSLKTDQGEQ